MAETRLDMANLQSAMGQPADAIHTLVDGLEQLRRALGAHHPQAINMLRALCSLERATDTLEAASRDCHASLQLAQELHGNNHRATVDANRQLAALYVDMGRFRDAEAIFTETTAWMGARLDPHHPDMARAYNSMAVVAWERGDIERAVAYQQQAVEAWRKSGNAGLIAKALPQAKLIRVVRDPLDACFSNLRTLFTGAAALLVARLDLLATGFTASPYASASSSDSCTVVSPCRVVNVYSFIRFTRQGLVVH